MRSHFLLLLPLESSTNVVIPIFNYWCRTGYLLGIGELSHLHLCKSSKNLIPSLLKIGEPIKKTSLLIVERQKNSSHHIVLEKRPLQLHCHEIFTKKFTERQKKYSLQQKLFPAEARMQSHTSKLLPGLTLKISTLQCCFRVTSHWQKNIDQPSYIDFNFEVVFRLLIMETDTIMLKIKLTLPS